MRRRDLLKAGALALAACKSDPPRTFRAPDGLFPVAKNPRYVVSERPLTDETLATSYNNYYELTDDKRRVKELAQDLDTDPWTVEVAGLCKRPRAIDLAELIRLPLEERVYRHRCVEAWSMTLPWAGFPLALLLELAAPLPEARFVRFFSRKKYYEALAIEEAKHELAFMAVGLYQKLLPRQNGAPIRLVVPWKYGFKSAKAIVRLEFVRDQPPTFWSDEAPGEYDFWANVDPTKPHPRWPQSSERSIVSRIDGERVLTQAYNGYADLVASMYAR
jgi:methionine sulfoxide reductase catalytic subunit